MSLFSLGGNNDIDTKIYLTPMNYNKIPKKTNDKVFSSVKAKFDYLVEENLLEREKQCVYCCGIVKIIEDPSYSDKKKKIKIKIIYWLKIKERESL